MNEKQEIIIVCLVFIAGIILVPFGIAALMHSAEPFRIIEGEPVIKAAEKAGISVCSVTETEGVLGAVGGVKYILSDNCENPAAKITVEVQVFDNEVSRDAAVRVFNSDMVGKSKSRTALIVVGQYLVYIDGDSGLLSRIAGELKKL